jgi:hypothetical protein
MAGAGKKTFTAGEVLTASDVNTYLMEQSVMYFGGTAARASAIPTPSTGMTTYIGTTGTASIPQIETYTGSAWQTPYAMTLVGRATLSSAAAISFDNVFTSTYTNYKILGKIAVTDTIRARMRVAGTDTTASNYSHANPNWLPYSGFDGVDRGDQISSWNWRATSGLTGFCVELFNPQQAAATVNTNQIAPTYAASGVWFTVGGGVLNNSTQYDGITIYPASGTMTGEIQIYGYRKS